MKEKIPHSNSFVPSGSEIIRIILTGAESTGKSTLAKQLAEYYETVFIPEYARTYVENLGRSYNYEDVVHIAKVQTKIEAAYLYKSKKYLFIDTGLIVTKVWFQEVYGKYPDWLNNAIVKNLPDFYLICDIDLPWKNDAVRENGTFEQRKYLMNKYIEEIKKFGVHYAIIKGQGDARLKNAINEIEKLSRYVKKK